MINPLEVKRYFARTLDDHLWMKGLRADDLDDMLYDLSPRPPLLKKLRLHQKVCLLLGIAYPRFFYMLDMGTGKTLLSMLLLKYWLRCGMIDNALILAPTEPVVLGWLEQNEFWGLDLPMTPLLGAGADKWDAFESNDGLFLATYQGISTMVSKKVKRSGAPGKRLKPDIKLVDRFADRCQGFVLDESTFVGNHQSLYYKVLKRMSSDATVTYALAGRAFGRNPELLWAQYSLIDHGFTLGPTLGFFREAFFTKIKNQFTRSSWAYDYKFDPKKKPELTRIMRHRSISYAADECVDLPKVVPLVRRVRFPGDMQAYYDRIVKQVIESRGNLQAQKSAFIRMRQISSGFLGFKDDETGDKAEVEFDHNPKLDELMHLVYQVPQDRKLVIFHEFTWSGRKITQALQDARMKHGWVWGGTKDYATIKKRFDDPDSDYRTLVVNWRKGAYGLNLQAANYFFYYESPVANIDRDQCDKRVARPGQLYPGPVFQYDLVMKDTADEKILEFHKEGQDLWRSMVQNPAKVLGGKLLDRRR